MKRTLITTLAIVMVWQISSYAEVTPKGPKGFRYLGKDGETVTLKKESVIAYGTSDKFYYLYYQKGTKYISGDHLGIYSLDPKIKRYLFYKPMNEGPAGYKRIGKLGDTAQINRLANLALGGGNRYAYLFQVKGTIKFDDKTFGFSPNPPASQWGFVQYIDDSVRNSDEPMGPPGYHYLGLEGSTARLLYTSKIAYSHYDHRDKFSFKKAKAGYLIIASKDFPERKRKGKLRHAYYKVSVDSEIPAEHKHLVAMPGASLKQVKKVMKYKNRNKYEEKSLGSGYMTLSPSLSYLPKSFPYIEYFMHKKKLQVLYIHRSVVSEEDVKPISLHLNRTRPDEKFDNALKLFLNSAILNDYQNAKLQFDGDFIISDANNGDWIAPSWVNEVPKPKSNHRLVKYERTKVFVGNKYAYELSIGHWHSQKKMRIWSIKQARKNIKVLKRNESIYKKWRGMKPKPLVAGKVQLHFLQDKADLTEHGSRSSYASYVPKGLNLAKKNRVLFINHGDGGNGKGSIRGWISVAKKLRLILIAPSYNWDHFGGKTENDDIFPRVMKDLHSKTKIKKKILVTGFSSGGATTHLSAVNQTKQVLAIAMHSSGAIGGVMQPDKALKNIAVLVTCGMKGPGCGGNKSYIGKAKKLRYRKALYAKAKNFKTARKKTLSFFKSELRRAKSKGI